MKQNEAVCAFLPKQSLFGTHKYDAKEMKRINSELKFLKNINIKIN
jgi:hypothetical protein